MREVEVLIAPVADRPGEEGPVLPFELEEGFGVGFLQQVDGDDAVMPPAFWDSVIS